MNFQVEKSTVAQVVEHGVDDIMSNAAVVVENLATRQ